MTSESFFHQLFGSIADGGRVLIDQQLRGLARQPGRAVADLCHALLSQRGEASGAALAREVLLAYGDLDAAGRTAFFQYLADEFRAEPDAIARAADAYRQEPSTARLIASGARRRGAAPGAVPAPQHGAGRHRGPGRDARDAAGADPRAARMARDRRGSPAPVPLLVQPRLPGARADRLAHARGRAREAHPLRGGACDRRLGRPEAAARARTAAASPSSTRLCRTSR